MNAVEQFGILPNGLPVNQYTLTNETGVTVKILNYGGIIRELWTPDRDGVPGNVVLSYDHLEDYRVNPAYIGAVIGRTAGRIRGGRLVIGDSHYDLPRNNGGNTLHGGPCGFHTKLMDAAMVEESDDLSLVLKFISEDGECGYPGKLAVEIRYKLMKHENILTQSIVGVSDQDTYLNMTNHSYFNLSARPVSIEDHRVALSADAYAEVDDEMLPKGGWTTVAGSVFDLQNPRRIGDVISSEDAQILCAWGIDHPFRLMDSHDQPDAPPSVSLFDLESGRMLTVGTSQPHMVVYTGNYLDAADVPSGKSFCRHQGICFEAQEVPDAPNNPEFACSLLEAGVTYSHTICYEFGIGQE